jgi:hypothetical protein
VAEQVDPVQPERLPHGGELAGEGIDDPQRGVVGVIGFPAAELVAKDHRPLAPAQPGEVFEVVVGEVRLAVRHQQRQPPAGGGKPAYHLVLRAVSPERHGPFGRRRHGHASSIWGLTRSGRQVAM